MKKTLIAMMVATLPAAAFADVTLYGKLKGGFETVDNGKNTQTNLDDLGSRIGFKGSEDVGNGLKAIWQVETGFKIDGTSGEGSSSGTFANRQSFIGLNGGFGTVRMGNLSNFQDSDMGAVDAWEYNSSVLGLGVFTRDATRIKNAVRYDTPELGGFKGTVLYGVKEVKPNVGAGTADSDRETYNVGLSYETGPFLAQYAYQHESPMTTGGKKGSANEQHRIELGYNANNLYVGFGAMYNKGDVTSTAINALNSKYSFAGISGYDGSKKFETLEYALTASYSLGAFTPKFTYAHGDKAKYDGNKLGDTNYDQFVVGADYALSKRTVIGAQYGYLKFKGKFDNNEDTQQAVGVSMTHAF